MRGLAAASRLTGAALACAAAASLLAGSAVAAGAVAARPAATALIACTARQLSASVESSSGAAGTLVLRIALRNAGAACALAGFPTLRLSAGGAALPSRTVHGGMTLLEAAADPVQLAPGGRAYLLVAYSELSAGGSRDTASSGGPGCSGATQVGIWVNGWKRAVGVPVHVTACSGGLLHTSPFLHPSSSRRSAATGTTASAPASGLQRRPSPGDL